MAGTRRNHNVNYRLWGVATCHSGRMLMAERLGRSGAGPEQTENCSNNQVYSLNSSTRDPPRRWPEAWEPLAFGPGLVWASKVTAQQSRAPRAGK